MLLGDKIKELRHKNNLTQEELADRCELTKGYISQLENELTSPSIAALIDILSALGTNLKEFFSDEEDSKIIFKKNDFIEKVADGYTINWLVPNAQKNLLEPIIMEINPNGETTSDMPHEGEEFGYIISGEATLVYGNKKHKIKPGQSFYFKCDKIHYLINNGTEKCKVLWISSPPNF